MHPVLSLKLMQKMTTQLVIIKKGNELMIISFSEQIFSDY